MGSLSYHFTSGRADALSSDNNRRFVAIPPEAHTLPPGPYRLNGRNVYWTGRVFIGSRYEPKPQFAPRPRAAASDSAPPMQLRLLHRLLGWWT